MILQLANLSASGSKFSGEDPVEALTWEADAYDIIRPAGPLRWTMTAKLFETELFIDGTVSALFSGTCARCGKDMTLEISEPLCFSVDVSGDVAEVDLTSELRDVILLALPNHPMCSTDCEVLAPLHGMPSEEESSTCPDVLGGSPWDVLDRLDSPTLSPTETGV